MFKNLSFSAWLGMILMIVACVLLNLYMGEALTPMIMFSIITCVCVGAVCSVFSGNAKLFYMLASVALASLWTNILNAPYYLPTLVGAVISWIILTSKRDESQSA